VHDFRVALRRLRTLLRPARLLYGKRRLREIGAELRRFAQATGALRDEEVLRETLSALELGPKARADLDRWLAARARQERALRRRVVALLTTPSGPEPSLGDALSHLERRLGRRHPVEMAAGDLAERAVGDAMAEVRSHLDAGPADVARMHALRIRYKRLRYTTELFSEILGERGEALVKASARMQKRLGELHDIDEALKRVARARSLSRATAGALRKALRGDRKKLADRLGSDLAEARKSELLSARRAPVIA
jgi:CHAD domain-containing protein